MVVGVFPALKLGVLFVKQISKPIAKVIVSQAKNHPVFRTYFIIPPAQFYHWAEVKAKMYLMNLGKPTKVAKLNEAMAIELGANLMGEVIIFSLAGGCLIFEYNRQATKEAKKEELRLAQIQKFTDDIQTLQQTTNDQEIEIRYLQIIVKELAKHTKIKLPSQDSLVELNNQMNNMQGTNEKSNVEKNTQSNIHNTEQKKQSLVEQAIVYYENNVKTERFS